MERLDHLVLTVRALDATGAFHEAIGFRHATVDVREPDRNPVELSVRVSRAD